MKKSVSLGVMKTASLLFFISKGLPLYSLYHIMLEVNFTWERLSYVFSTVQRLDRDIGFIAWSLNCYLDCCLLAGMHLLSLPDTLRKMRHYCMDPLKDVSVLRQWMSWKLLIFSWNNMTAHFLLCSLLRPVNVIKACGHNEAIICTN